MAYEHLVRDVIDNSFLKHKRISLFLTDDDNLIPFDRAMALAFNGSGYAYDDGEIVSDDDDDAIARMTCSASRPHAARLRTI